VLLFNLCGYRFVINYIQQKQDVKLTAQLDKDEYADADLISIKTALSLPYYNASMEFERVDGSIQINGIEYKYVKRRIINDSLELLCLPNTAKQKLQTAKSDFFKLSNDLQRTDNKKSTNIIKSVVPEYCNALTTYSLQALYIDKQKYLPVTSHFSSSLFALAPEQPPETMRSFS
jgi:hypothetical protein